MQHIPCLYVSLFGWYGCSSPSTYHRISLHQWPIFQRLCFPKKTFQNSLTVWRGVKDLRRMNGTSFLCKTFCVGDVSHLLLHSLPIIFPLPFSSYLLLLSSFCFPTSLSLMFLLLISLPFSQLLFYLCPFSFCSLSQLLFCNSRIIRTKIRRMSVKRALCFDFNLLLSFEGRHRDL